MSEAAQPGFSAADPREQRPASPRPTALDLPDRRLFWRWVWEAIRPVVGWVLAALGAVALFLGWYGVSGEALTAKQLPYLVSGGLTGIGLIILAGVFLATDDVRRQLARLDDMERKLDDLYGLFAADLATAPAAQAGPAAAARPTTATTTTAAPVSVAPTTAAPTAAGPAAGEVVALPAGSSYHRRDCALVAGKAEAAAVDADTVRSRGLKPCRVCDPAPIPG